MRTRIIQLFAAISFVICISTWALWWRSFDHADQVMFTGGTAIFRPNFQQFREPTYHLAIQSDEGAVIIEKEDDHTVISWPASQPALAPSPEFAYRTSDSFGRLAALSFGFRAQPPVLPFAYSISPTTSDRRIVLPLICVPMISALLPLVVVSGTIFRALRRPKPGACHACGYLLTGNVTGICPECGTEADPSTRATSRTWVA